MRLITWNCQGAFRKKAHLILDKNPDILVVQECEHPDKLLLANGDLHANDTLWFGDNKNRGLCIFSFNGFKISAFDQYQSDIKIIVPILVTIKNIHFGLFAIWANNRNDPDGQYIEQVWKAIKYYNNILETYETILIGDFNSNKIWDRKHRVGNHSYVVEKLAEKNIHSVYHEYFGIEQGMEIHPTFFLQRNINKPYHIDYCFTSQYLYRKIVNFQVGAHDQWISKSDHTPLIITFDL